MACHGKKITSMLARGISFILRNSKNIPYIFRYAYAYPQKSFTQKVHFCSDEELVTFLNEGKSMLRIGDGEIYMLNYGSIPQYEPYNKDLRKRLLTIITEYSTSSSYLIGIPVFAGYSNEQLRALGKLHVWLPLKILYHYLFPHRPHYFDAHMFYRDGGFEKSVAAILKKHHVIIITRKHNIDLIEETTLRDNSLSLTYIETPERETFAQVDAIVERVLTLTKGTEQAYRVICACGPASKILVYELSKKGVVSYDLGKGIETVYRKNEIEHHI